MGATTTQTISGFSIKPSDVRFIDGKFVRPECLITTASGDHYCSDARGGVTMFRDTGVVKSFLATNLPKDFIFVPNGFSVERDGSFLIANVFDHGGVWKLARDGAVTPFLREVDGTKINSTNFVGRDSKGRLWISVSTRHATMMDTLVKGWADGYVILVDEKGPRIVADGLSYTNEAKVDPSGRWLYVSETMARKLTRFEIRADGTLGAKETVADFGWGAFPDGLTFDAEGEIWVAITWRTSIVRVDAETGKQQIIFEDYDRNVVDEIETKYQQGVMPFGLPDPNHTGLVTSVAFGGPDLKTVYFQSLGATDPSDPTGIDRVGTFRSPVAGAETPYWR